MATTIARHAKLFYRLNNELYSSKTIIDSYNLLKITCQRCSCHIPLKRNITNSVSTADHDDKETVTQLTWKLMGAVCLERPPTLTSKTTMIETEYKTMVDSLEFENSVLSEHELQLIADRKRMEQKQKGEIDDDDDPATLLSAQDVEDLATEEYNQFKLASRTTEADKTGKKTTTQRKLDENLVLLVRKNIGNQKVWMMPYTEHQEGESLRQTAERAAVQVGTGAITFLGNAPIGFYKYKFPNKVKNETGAIGAKVFFFKAKIFKGEFTVYEGNIDDHVWVNKTEMREYLTPAYLESAMKFIH